MGAPLADADGVAVWFGAGEPADAKIAAGARDILDHDRLAERFSHRLCDDTRNGVERPARGERRDQRDRARGEGLRERGGGAGGDRDQRRNEQFHHRNLSNCQSHTRTSLRHPEALARLRRAPQDDGERLL
jgi:hypothetical protein